MSGIRRARPLAALAACVALLASAPGASAADYVVNDPGDADATTPGIDCAGGGTCTLRAAIQTANASVGVADTITLQVSPADIGALNSSTTPSSAVTDPVEIDGGGARSVTFAAGADGPLLEIAAPDTTVSGITFTGGSSGPGLAVAGARAKLDSLHVDSIAGVAVDVTGTGARLSAVAVGSSGTTGIAVHGTGAALTAPTVTGAGASGIAISAGGASVTSPEIAAAVGAGIVSTASNVTVSGGRIHGNAGDGITITGQSTVVTRVVMFGNGGKPIALGPGANAGVQPPSGLRIGPRQADGSLPLTGSTPGGGSIELWSGSPFGPLAPSFVEAFAVAPGPFTYHFASEPPPGASYALALTTSGTSEFSTVAVPSDVVSPDIVRARALSTTDVRVFPSEPLDPASVEPADFKLTMAGNDREVSAAAIDPASGAVTLTSSGWKAGEAGYVELTGAGALADTAGNASLNATRLRVAAAPGDFIAPIAGELKLTPKTICLTRGRGCRNTGTRIRFVTTEPGKARVVIMRGNKRIGDRLYGAVDAGLNTVRWNGRIGSRKLRAGRYRVLLYVQDLVGNVSDQPPIALMSVRRVTR